MVKNFADNGSDIDLKTKDGKNCLHIAALHGHISLCKTLIHEHNFDVHTVDNDGWTALHFSTRNNSYELIEYFVDMGSDIYLKTNDGKNCLHIAALYGHLNLCKTLIDEYHFDVQIADDDGWTALHFSTRSNNYKLVKYVANMVSDIHLKTNDGKNCLHIAALSGYLYLCKTLIVEHNFNIHMADDGGWTALHFSARNGNYELVKYFGDMKTEIKLKTNHKENSLITKASYGCFNPFSTLSHLFKFERKYDIYEAHNDVWKALHLSTRYDSYGSGKYSVDKRIDMQLRTKDGMNCLHIAALYGHLDICKTLVVKHRFNVRVTDDEGWAVLHFSAKNGSYELVKYFADMGSDISLKTNDGKNCVHIAALYGHLNLCETLIEYYNFNANMADDEGWTAFHFSARNGSYELVKYFADMGSDIYLKTNDGKNCLHIAAIYGHLNLCKTLKEKYNFNANMADDDGWTAFHFSVKNNSYELFKYFVDVGSEIHLKTNHGKNCLHTAALYGHLNLCKTLVEKHNFEAHIGDDEGWTPFHVSTRNNDYKLFKYFVDKGSDIHLRTNDGKNCLHIAALYGHLNLCQTLIDKHDFYVDMTDDEGWTGLHFSTRNGSYELVKYFVEMGSDIYCKTNDAKNCLHIAALNGHVDLCKMFLDYYKFDVHLTDNNECTALHYSAENGNFGLFQFILGKGSEIYSKTKSMKNVLHLSAHNGHFDICKFVLEYFTMDYKNNNTGNQHALFGRSYRSQIFFKYSIIFLHAMDVDGNTYLHLAAEGNHSKICRLLLKYDTEILTLSNKKDKTARDIARDNDHGDVLNALKPEYDRAGAVFFIFLKKFHFLKDFTT